MPAELTDEACIAIAMLHGAHFHKWLEDPGFGCWQDGGHDEELNWMTVTGETREEAARKYCERHNLLR